MVAKGRTAVSNDWLAERLAMGHSSYVSTLVQRIRRDKKEGKTLRKYGFSEKFVGEFGFREISKCMKKRNLQEIEAPVAVGFSHAQIHPQVEPLDHFKAPGFLRESDLKILGLTRMALT